MRKRFYLILTLYSFFIISCQKGDESVNPYQELAQLTFVNTGPFKLLYNGEPASTSNNGASFNVLPGKAKLSLVNSETGKTEFEGEFDIKPKDTLYVFQPSPALPLNLIRNTQSSEPEREGYIKIKIANFASSITDGNEFINLAFRQQIGQDPETWEPIYSEKSDTIKNVTDQFEDIYSEIPVKIEGVEINTTVQYLVEVLSPDNHPILREGKPIKLIYLPSLLQIDWWNSDGNDTVDLIGPKVYMNYINHDNLYYREDLGYWTGDISFVF